MKKIFFELDSFEDNYKQTQIVTISLLNYDKDDNKNLFLVNKEFDIVNGWYTDYNILGDEPKYFIRDTVYVILFNKLVQRQLNEGRRLDDVYTQEFTLENLTVLVNIFGDDLNTIVQKISNFISNNNTEKHTELSLYNLESVFNQKVLLDLMFYGYRNIQTNIFNILVKSELEILIQKEKNINPNIVELVQKDQHFPKVEEESSLLDIENKVKYSKSMHHFINDFINGDLVYTTEESEGDEPITEEVEEFDSKEL